MYLWTRGGVAWLVFIVRSNTFLGGVLLRLVFLIIRTFAWLVYFWWGERWGVGQTFWGLVPPSFCKSWPDQYCRLDFVSKSTDCVVLYTSSWMSISWNVLFLNFKRALKMQSHSFESFFNTVFVKIVHFICISVFHPP